MPRYNNINIGLPNVGFTPSVFQPSREFAPVNSNIGFLQHSLDKMDARKETADKLTSDVNLDLAKVNLHESDDAWKQQYINKINQAINQHIQVGDYHTALEVARKMASTVANDPELRARERNNIIYQQAVSKVENNNTIDDVTKRRWKAENQFSNAGLYDENGNFTGGTVWKESWTPVKPIDKFSLYSKLKQIVAPEAGSYDDVVFMDADGNYTRDYKEGTMGMAIKTSTGYQRVSADKYKQALATLWEQEPNAIQALDQEFKDKRFHLNELKEQAAKLDQNSQEYRENLEQQNNITDQITDREGNYISEESYLNKQMHPVLDKMAYNNVNKSVTVGDAAQNLYKRNLQQQSVENYLQGQFDSTVGQGPMVEEVTQDNYTLANSGVEAAYQSLCKLFPMFGQGNSQVYKYMKAGKTDKAIELAKRYVSTNTFNLDSSLRAKMMDELNIMEDNLATLNELNKGITNPADKQAIAFKAAFDGDSSLPNANTNVFSKMIIDAKNDIFGNSDKIAIRIQTDDSDNEYRLTKALTAGGISRQQLSESGIEVKNINGEQYVYIPKTSKYTDRLLYGFANSDDDFWHKTDNVTRMYSVNGDGTIGRLVELPERNPVAGYTMGRNIVENILKPFNHAVNGATAKSTQAIRSAGKMTTVAPVVLYGTSGAQDEDMYRSYMMGQMSSDQYNQANKRNDDIKNKMVTSQSLQNFNVYWDESGQSQTLKKADNEVKGQISQWLREARDNKRAFNWQYASKDGQYGVYIDFGSKLDKNGNAVADEGTYAGIRVWVPGLLADQSERAAARDTKNRTVTQMAHLQHFNTQRTTVFGNKVSNVYNDGNNAGAKINGQDVSYDEAKQEILRDFDFRQLENIYQGVRSQADLNNFAGKGGWLDKTLQEMYPNLEPDSYEYNNQKIEILKLLDARNNNNN